jgi:hypothetical protein
MVHPQVRREAVPAGAASTELGTAEPAFSSVPRQQPREHPDAYDLYAQIYALRTDLPADGPG